MPKGGIYVYQCKATISEAAPLDDESMEERRLILQGRITEKMMSGSANMNVLAYYYGSIPTLYVDEVKARGSKLVIDIVWAVDRAAIDYVIARQNSKNSAVAERSAHDEDF